jgi:acetyl esterase/lipase
MFTMLNCKNSFLCFFVLILMSAGSIYAQDRTVVYKKIDSLELKMYIFNPKGHQSGDKTPCIVLFHGGGWNNGHPKSFFKQAKYLASRGMVAMSAQYRLRDSNGTSPKECVIDGKSAIRWVRFHASELGIDPNMLAAGGGSAGGHIAAATATLKAYNDPKEDTTVSAKPNALVLLNPVIDNGPTGYGFSKVKDYWQGFSPMHNIDSTTPPTIFLVGTKDDRVPVETSKKYKEIMDKFGRRCDLLLYENEVHSFYSKSKYNETLFAIDKFLTSLGYLKGEPTIEPVTKEKE